MTDANTALEEALKAVLEGADALESLLQAAENGASPQAAQEAGRRLYNYTLSLPEEHGRVAEREYPRHSVSQGASRSVWSTAWWQRPRCLDFFLRPLADFSSLSAACIYLRLDALFLLLGGSRQA